MKVLKSAVFSFLILLTYSAKAEHPSHVAGELIVKIGSEIEAGEEDIFKVISDQLSFEQFKEKLQKEKEVKVLNSYSWAHIHHIRIHPQDDLNKMMEEIKKMPGVEYVEPNYILKLQTAISSLDFKAGQAASFSQPSKDESSLSKEMTQDQPVTIAVIDTGIDYTHIDIAPYLWVNKGEIAEDKMDNDGNGYVDDMQGWDFVNNDNDPYDDHFHGTHVTGIILNQQDKLNPVMKIMALKFLDSEGFGSTGNAIKAIDYAIKNGAKVLNNSWGGGGFSFALRDAIVASYNANKVFVVAAGNSAQNLDQEPTYPPSYLVPNIISVAALNEWDNLAWFSNYGPNTVHVGAQGISIYSAVPKEKCRAQELPPCYAYLTGTSMAAPYVSGVAAMMLSKNPELMHLQVKSVIMETSVSNASLQGLIGKGSVKPDDAVLTASNTEPDGNIPPYSPASLPGSIGLTAENASVMGCGMLADSYFNNSDDSSSSSSGSSSGANLFLLSWPFLFVFFLRILLLNKRRKLLFSQF